MKTTAPFADPRVENCTDYRTGRLASSQILSGSLTASRFRDHFPIMFVYTPDQYTPLLVLVITRAPANESPASICRRRSGLARTRVTAHGSRRAATDSFQGRTTLLAPATAAAPRAYELFLPRTFRTLFLPAPA